MEDIIMNGLFLKIKRNLIKALALACFTFGATHTAQAWITGLISSKIEHTRSSLDGIKDEVSIKPITAKLESLENYLQGQIQNDILRPKTLSKSDLNTLRTSLLNLLDESRDDHLLHDFIAYRTEHSLELQGTDGEEWLGWMKKQHDGLQKFFQIMAIKHNLISELSEEEQAQIAKANKAITEVAHTARKATRCTVRWNKTKKVLVVAGITLTVAATTALVLVSLHYAGIIKLLPEVCIYYLDIVVEAMGQNAACQAIYEYSAWIKTSGQGAILSSFQWISETGACKFVCSKGALLIIKGQQVLAYTHNNALLPVWNKVGLPVCQFVYSNGTLLVTAVKNTAIPAVVELGKNAGSFIASNASTGWTAFSGFVSTVWSNRPSFSTQTPDLTDLAGVNASNIMPC